MTANPSHESLLRELIELTAQNNRQMKPGSPMAELQAAIEAAVASLPPLEFQEYTAAVEDGNAAARLVQQAPDLIGWNADQIVEWIEELAKKL